MSRLSYLAARRALVISAFAFGASALGAGGAMSQTALQPSERPDESQSETPASPPKAADVSQSACAVLFGSHDVSAQNQAWREDNLFGFETTPDAWTVTHRVPDWSTPKPARFSNVHILRTQNRGSEKVAIVRVEEALAGCPVGEYMLRADQALGPDTQILAVADGVVLLDHAGALQTWMPEGAPRPPQIDLIWRSDYSIVLSSGGGSSSTKATKSNDRSAKAKKASAAAKRRAKARKNKKK